MKTETNNQTGLRAGIGRRAGVAALPALLSVGLLLGGCTEEPLAIPGGSIDGMTEISFVTESMGEVELESRSLSGIDENLIEDMWVIQLNSDGTKPLLPPQYISTVGGSGATHTVKAQVKFRESRLYFVANTHNQTLYSDIETAADVAAVTMEVAGESAFASGGLPMVGTWSGTPSTTDLNAIALTRAAAKVTFKLAADLAEGHTFTLRSVKVHNVPQRLHPYRDPAKLDPGKDAAATYPATSVPFAADWADLTPADKSLSAEAKVCGVVYLPENARGTGTAADQKQKTALTALGGEQQGNYATYIYIRGEYGADGRSFDVTYSLYLGGDAVSNYDVKRNTHYTVTATIRGIDEMDARITFFRTDLGQKYYDYTDNGSARFLYAQANALSSGTTLKAAMSECQKKDGWRLPTLTELDIIFCMRDTWQSTSNGMTAQNYWTSTPDSGNPNACYYMNFATGENPGSGVNGPNYVRCVRVL